MHKSDYILYGGAQHLWVLSVQHAFCLTTGAYNFEMAPRFLENLFTPATDNSISATVYRRVFEIRLLLSSELITSLKTTNKQTNNRELRSSWLLRSV